MRFITLVDRFGKTWIINADNIVSIAISLESTSRIYLTDKNEIQIETSRTKELIETWTRI